MGSNSTLYPFFENITTTENISLLHSRNEKADYFDDSFSKTENDVIASVYLSMAIGGFFLNTLTICIIGVDKNMNNDAKIQIINLAVADALMDVFGPIRFIMGHLRLSFVSNLPLCKLILFLEFSSHYTSLLCVVAISLERLVIIYFPFRARQYRSNHKLLVVGLAWLIGSLPSLEVVMRAGLKEINGIHSCIDVGPKDLASYQMQTKLWSLKYLLPILIIVGSYSLVCIKICSRESTGVTWYTSPLWKKDLNNVRQ